MSSTCWDNTWCRTCQYLTGLDTLVASTPHSVHEVTDPGLLRKMPSSVHTLLKQLFVPPCTTFVESGVEWSPQGKHSKWPWNQETAGSHGNSSHPPIRRAKLMSTNQEVLTEEPLSVRALRGSALKSGLNRIQILHNRAQPFRLAVFHLWDCLSFYSHLESADLQGCDKSTWTKWQWGRMIQFFHWLFSMQLKNHSLKKISTVSKH